MQMGLVLDENAVVPDGWRAPMLSSYIGTEENWGNVISLYKSDRYTASWLAYASPITPIRMTRAQLPVVSSSPTSLVLLQTGTINLKRSENCWDRRCG